MFTVLMTLLVLIGVGGLGVGVWTVVTVTSAPRVNEFGVALAIAYGSIPFAIGVVALGSVAVVMAIERAARDQVAAIIHLTDMTTGPGGSAPPSLADPGQVSGSA